MQTNTKWQKLSVFSTSPRHASDIAVGHKYVRVLRIQTVAEHAAPLWRPLPCVRTRLQTTQGGQARPWRLIPFFTADLSEPQLRKALPPPRRVCTSDTHDGTTFFKLLFEKSKCSLSDRARCHPSKQRGLNTNSKQLVGKGELLPSLLCAFSLPSLSFPFLDSVKLSDPRQNSALNHSHKEIMHGFKLEVRDIQAHLLPPEQLFSLRAVSL